MKLAAAVLAGGQSSRMRTDKALLPWDGNHMLDHALDVLGRLTCVTEVFVVGMRSEYLERGSRIVADDYPGRGPLGGIATALRAAREHHVLVVAVDMPLLSVPLLQALCEFDLEGDALVPNVGGWQPLHAIYSKTALPAIEAQIQHNRLKISDVFDLIDVQVLRADWIAEYDPDFSSFENANTPEDYERLQKVARISEEG